MRRHHATTAAAQTPTPRRRPVWNAYLTDDAQYRLSEQQQLQRQLQQLSTAHFSSRSPSHALRAANLAPTPRRHHGSIDKHSRSSEYAMRDDSLARTHSAISNRATPQSVRPRSADSAGRRRRPGATVSFQLDHDDGRSDDDHAHKASLQNELAALEQMLEVLEAETATLHHDEALQMPPRVHQFAPQQALRATARPSSLQKHERDAFGAESDGDITAPSPRARERVRAPPTDSGSDDDDTDDGPDASARLPLRSTSHSQSPRARLRRPFEDSGDETDDGAQLSEACYKSLRISAQLAKKMDQLTRELAHERQLRLDQELKLDVLEQEVRSTRARCTYLEAKYESVLAQVDDMRNALLTTRRTHEQLTPMAVRRKAKKVATPSRSPVVALDEQHEQEPETEQENQRHRSNTAQN